MASNEQPANNTFQITGVTQCTPRGRALIAPAIAGRVLSVLVEIGSRVTVGQPLVKLDPTAAQGRQKGKQALCESAKAGLVYQQRVKQADSQLVPQGATPAEEGYKHQMEFLQAQQALAGAEAELAAADRDVQDCTVSAALEGVVSRLDTSPGAIADPGSEEWGEILNLDAEIDIMCPATPEQADSLRPASATAQVRVAGKELPARIVSVGIQAERKDSKVHVPVLVRLDNSMVRLSCGVDVDVRFTIGQLA